MPSSYKKNPKRDILVSNVTFSRNVGLFWEGFCQRHQKLLQSCLVLIASCFSLTHPTCYGLILALVITLFFANLSVFVQNTAAIIMFLFYFQSLSLQFLTLRVLSQPKCWCLFLQLMCARMFSIYFTFNTYHYERTCL